MKILPLAVILQIFLISSCDSKADRREVTIQSAVVETSEGKHNDSDCLITSRFVESYSYRNLVVDASKCAPVDINRLWVGVAEKVRSGAKGDMHAVILSLPDDPRIREETRVLWGKACAKAKDKQAALSERVVVLELNRLLMDSKPAKAVLNGLQSSAIESVSLDGFYPTQSSVDCADSVNTVPVFNFSLK